MNRKIIALLEKEIFLLAFIFNVDEIKTCKYCEKKYFQKVDCMKVFINYLDEL